MDESLRDDPDGFNKIVTVVNYGFSWTKWSDTRLGGMGPSSRKWILSCALGIDTCFRLALESPATSAYYANGYLKAAFEVLKCWSTKPKRSLRK